MILDEGDYAGRNLGLEMLEATRKVTPEIERRVNEKVSGHGWDLPSFLLMKKKSLITI